MQTGRRRPTSGCVGGRWRCGLLRQHHAPFGRKIPRQKLSDVFRCLPTGRRAVFQVPRQPQSRIDFPVSQCGQQRKHCRCQPATPEGPRAVEVLSRHGRTATCSFQSVVVHRNARIIDKPNESRPVLLQAFQNLAARLAEFGIGKFRYLSNKTSTQIEMP